MSSALDYYNQTSVGDRKTFNALNIQENNLIEAQRIVNEFDELERQGLIKIQVRHKETETGKHYVDLVMFERLR